MAARLVKFRYKTGIRPKLIFGFMPGPSIRFLIDGSAQIQRSQNSELKLLEQLRLRDPNLGSRKRGRLAGGREQILTHKQKEMLP